MYSNTYKSPASVLTLRAVRTSTVTQEVTNGKSSMKAAELVPRTVSHERTSADKRRALAQFESYPIDKKKNRLCTELCTAQRPAVISKAHYLCGLCLQLESRSIGIPNAHVAEV